MGKPSDELETEIQRLEERLANAKTLISEEKIKWKEATSPGKFGSHWKSAREKRKPSIPTASIDPKQKKLQPSAEYKTMLPQLWSSDHLAQWLKEHKLTACIPALENYSNSSTNSFSGKEFMKLNPRTLKQLFSTGNLSKRDWSVLLSEKSKLRNSNNTIRANTNNQSIDKSESTKLPKIRRKPLQVVVSTSSSSTTTHHSTRRSVGSAPTGQKRFNKSLSINVTCRECQLCVTKSDAIQTERGLFYCSTSCRRLSIVSMAPFNPTTQRAKTPIGRIRKGRPVLSTKQFQSNNGDTNALDLSSRSLQGATEEQQKRPVTMNNNGPRPRPNRTSSSRILRGKLHLDLKKSNDLQGELPAVLASSSPAITINSTNRVVVGRAKKLVRCNPMYKLQDDTKSRGNTPLLTNDILNLCLEFFDKRSVLRWTTTCKYSAAWRQDDDSSSSRTNWWELQAKSSKIYNSDFYAKSSVANWKSTLVTMAQAFHRALQANARTLCQSQMWQFATRHYEFDVVKVIVDKRGMIVAGDIDGLIYPVDSEKDSSITLVNQVSDGTLRKARISRCGIYNEASRVSVADLRDIMKQKPLVHCFVEESSLCSDFQQYMLVRTARIVGQKLKRQHHSKLLAIARSDREEDLYLDFYDHR